jgi:glucan 1,3-beta-glucosidase
MLTRALCLAVLVVYVYSYVVERNVRDYGAKGDGITDDSEAIIRALTEGRASDPSAKYPNAIYPASTQRPGFVYFPAGTYLVTQTLPVVYYTQMVGDADNLPVIKMVSHDPNNEVRVLESMGKWYPGANQDNFYKQIRNFIIDMTECAKCTGVHWQVAQATSLSNMYS